MTSPLSSRDAALDRHDAVDALYRFAAGQDDADRDLFASAFAPEAVLDFTAPARRFGARIAPFHGRDTIVATVFTNLTGLLTTHTVTNPRVTLDGDRATVSALVEAQHVPATDPTRHLLLKNRYRTELRRDDTRWVITTLVIDTVWHTGDPTVLFSP